MLLRTLVMSAGLLGLVAAAPVPAPSTQPAAPDDRLEFRAARAFDNGDYATALPLLKQLADQLKDRPAKLPVVQERIKACEKALGPATSGAARTPHPAPVPGQVQTMTIKELGNFDYDGEKGGNIPADVKRLSGSKVRLTGFMIPADQADHITRFALVPSLFSCCFGQPPQVQHTIVVTCPRGKAVSYDPEQIVVEGTLTVEEKKEDGFIISIFQLEPASITEAPKDAKP
ncbi:MAG TPA: DUF3299 domain-containing protein [Tepidisphaeraceae bacterium]|jgi:hypothetical protein